MRVLAVTNLYPNPLQPHRATFTRRQLRVLGARHPVRVIAPISWTDELCARKRIGASSFTQRRVITDGITVDHPRIYYMPGMLRNMYGHCFYWSIHKPFRKVCREFRPSVVYAPWVYPDGWAAVRLAKELGLPVVLKALGSDVLLLDRHEGRRIGTIHALSSADGIVAVSKDLASRIIGLGASSDSTRVIYDGLEKQLFRPGCKLTARRTLGIPAERSMLLFVGNLVPIKGLDTLLHAVTLLRRRGVPCQLHVIGEGPLRDKLIAATRRDDIDKDVHWHGSVPQSRLPEWYRAADVMVLPSRSEGVPNVLLEAAACKTPWVASRVGGIPEIAHLGASRLVEPDQVVPLAEAIKAMINTPPIPGDAPRDIEDMVEELTAFLLHIQTHFMAKRATA